MDALEKYWVWLCEQILSGHLIEDDYLIDNELTRIGKHITWERKLVAFKHNKSTIIDQKLVDGLEKHWRQKGLII